MADAFLTGYTLVSALPDKMDSMDDVATLLWSYLVKAGYPVTKVETHNLIREYEDSGGLVM